LSCGKLSAGEIVSVVDCAVVSRVFRAASQRDALQ